MVKLQRLNCVVSFINMTQPLILVTNDDGIASLGLWAAVEALLPLGELLVVAPDRQWSGAGRAMLHTVTGRVTEAGREINGRRVTAYAVDATPAQAVIHGLTEFAPRRPSLVVSGINSGENISTEVSVSGTVGAALEAAAHGIPALAVSLAMPQHFYLTEGENPAVDYTTAAASTQHFGRLLLQKTLPYTVDVLNVNVPWKAKPGTPWRLTRLSRQRYFLPLAPDRDNGHGRPGFKLLDDPAQAEPDSDVWALRIEKVISVTPISLDMTSQADFGALEERLRAT